MAAKAYDLLLEQGATFRLVITVTNAAGAEVDIDGYEARMQVRPSTVVGEDPDTPLLSYTTDDALSISGSQVTLTVPAEDTAALTWATALYDLEIESLTGQVDRLIGGHVWVDPEITR